MSCSQEVLDVLDSTRKQSIIRSVYFALNSLAGY